VIGDQSLLARKLDFRLQGCSHNCTIIFGQKFGIFIHSHVLHVQSRSSPLFPQTSSAAGFLHPELIGRPSGRREYQNFSMLRSVASHLPNCGVGLVQPPGPEKAGTLQRGANRKEGYLNKLHLFGKRAAWPCLGLDSLWPIMSP
jgi:hypothetical protein